MNLVEELQSLDANDVGRWPLPFRVAVIVIVFVLVTALGIYFTIIKDKAPLLERAQNEEQELRLACQNVPPRSSSPLRLGGSSQPPQDCSVTRA